MGCNSSSPAGVDISPAEASKSNKIDREIERRRQEQDSKVKLLLLGAGESGKSTIFKQMRILYGTNRPDDDLRMYGTVVRANIIVAVRKLISHLRHLGLETELDTEDKASKDSFENADLMDSSGMLPREAYDILVEHLVDMSASAALVALAKNDDPDMPQDSQKDWVGCSQRAGKTVCNDAKLFHRFVTPIRTIWNSDTMKLVWAQRASVNVNDSHKDYLRDLSRISSPDYRPSTQDILLARMRTTQVTMERYQIDGIDFEMYDVGGQRSERRKWIDCFDSVDAVIFVAALSEYDQTLAEAKRTNRMVEALELFRSICNNSAFAETSIMLFLNKKDLFAEKLDTSDIAAQQPFSDYFGPPQDFDHGVQYFIEKFKDCLMDDDFSENFIHVTMATDTNNMEFVLEASKTIIMNENLKNSGFLGTD